MLRGSGEEEAGRGWEGKKVQWKDWNEETESTEVAE